MTPPDVLVDQIADLEAALAELVRPPFAMFAEWLRSGSTRSADAMDEWQQKADRAKALLERRVNG